MTDEQLHRLPRLVRAEIVSLRRKIHALQEELKIHNLAEPTHVRWGYGFHDEAIGYLKNDETVFFQVGPANRGTIRVRRNRDGHLTLNADGRLVMRLRSSDDCSFTVDT